MIEDTFHEIKVPKVLALCGKAGSGKSTAASILVEEYGYTLVKFAAPLKDMLRAIGMTNEQIEGGLKEIPSPLLLGQTPRYAMQTLGTEWGRNIIGEDFWCSVWRNRARKILDAGGKVLTDDCRFENELRSVRQMSGTAINIERPGLASIGTHASETSLDVSAIHTVTNDGTPLQLVARILGKVEA